MGGVRECLCTGGRARRYDYESLANARCVCSERDSELKAKRTQMSESSKDDVSCVLTCVLLCVAS